MEAIRHTFDVFFILILSPIIIPIIVIASIACFISHGCPVLFTQLRPGKNGKPFKLYKFRSMKATKLNVKMEMPDEFRLTNFGKVLRSTSLDELPELWNVLKGDMSLVGPRPLLMEYLPLYSSTQARRHEVRPGITGWAQVNGRNALSWDEKFALDIWYVDNRSFWLDIKILLITVKKVILREGISGGGEVTMSKFTGSKP